MNRPLVTISIVTFDSERHIERCLQHVFDQTYSPVEVIVVDNASADQTPILLRAFETRARVIYNGTNNGFAGGQNQGIALARGAWILTLNPDVRLSPDFIGNLVQAGQRDSQIGTVCGKLLSMTSDFEPLHPPVLDSTGIYFTPNLRHFDRGSREPDIGAYDRPEFVFGATGAAALYRRTMIDQISVPGGFFDPAFFAYREDADVAWRAQLLGWKCLYAPSAIAHHVRHVLPANRTSVSKLINMHSVKNRFLMRINNITAGVYLRYFVSITVRDLLIVAACVLRERSSLPAFTYILRHWRSAWRNRRWIMSRRRTTDQDLAPWFAASTDRSRLEA